MLFACTVFCAAQDSLLKIHHAEPLYADLIRDLGARKGEREWNVGFGMKDERNFISYSGFMEYEFSPVDRLGLEIEIPFSFYQTITQENQDEETPRHRMEGIKTAMQYTFWVSEKYRLSMAAGYMNELKVHSFMTISDRQEFVKGNAYSPFVIVAKRWGRNFHSLIYTGPVWEQEFRSGMMNNSVQLNASMHYVLTGTSHFIGVEFNQEFSGSLTESVIRPQAKIKLATGLCLGLLTGIPTNFEKQRMSFMVRVIYEPKKIAKR